MSRFLSGPAHVFQVRGMRNDGMAHFSEFNIFYAVFLAGLFNDLADGRVVDMRDFREQVMFYLEIQTANKPADHFIPGGKICRGLYLVYGPFILNGIDICIGYRESGFLHRVRQLKNNAQYKAGKHGIGQKTNQPRKKAPEIDRHQHKKYQMQ